MSIIHSVTNRLAKDGAGISIEVKIKAPEGRNVTDIITAAEGLLGLIKEDEKPKPAPDPAQTKLGFEGGEDGAGETNDDEQ